jgi:hypothetical protein
MSEEQDLVKSIEESGLADSSEVAVEGQLETPGEFIDPTTGLVVNPSDVDSMVEMYGRVESECRKFYDLKRKIAQAMFERTTGNAKTRRLEGEKHRIRLEKPDDYWDQSILKEIWNSYPKHRDQFLRIDSIAVKLVPYKQLLNTAGPEDLEQVKKMLNRANRGPMGTPRIKIER